MKPTRSNTGVWMHDTERCESVSRMVAIDAMAALGHDPDDFRLRDRIITAINTRINQTLDAVADSGELTRLRERVAELEAIVDQLPKTADGVTVVPGMKVYIRDPCGYVQSLDVRDWQKSTDSSVPYPDYSGTWACYSTREAAEAAGGDDA